MNLALGSIDGVRALARPASLDCLVGTSSTLMLLKIAWRDMLLIRKGESQNYCPVHGYPCSLE